MRMIRAKSILSPSNNVNLYRGCSHGCIYCDSRSLVYQVGPFEDIAVKQDAIAIMRQELSRKTKKSIITTGSMCDPYLHLESELKLTRQMLELIHNTGHGVLILTKSDLALRDIDLIRQINERYKAIVCYTVTTIDDALCAILEPNVANSSRRLECLRQFSQAGVLTGVWMTPILPWINDTLENITGIVEACSKAGVRYIMNFGMGLTLRAGNREHFLEMLDRHFPGLSSKYIQRFGFDYACNSPNRKKLTEQFVSFCEAHRIVYKHNEIHELLQLYHSSEQMTLF